MEMWVVRCLLKEGGFLRMFRRNPTQAQNPRGKKEKELLCKEEQGHASCKGTACAEVLW
jgi:hypothetical protein